MPDLILVDSTDEVENLMRWLGERRPILAFDSETTGLDPFRDTIRLAQFGDAETAWALPYDDWRGVVREIFARYTEPMVMHNAKYDVSMLEADGIKVDRPKIQDSMLATVLADNTGPKALKLAAGRYVDGKASGPQKDLKDGMRRAGWTFATVPVRFGPYWHYAALDTIYTAKLWAVLEPKIEPMRDAYELELAVLWPLLNLEQRGARIDVDYCRSTSKVLREDLREVEGRWPELNLHASGQVIDALELAGFKLTKKTDSGALSVDEEVLAGIDHVLARDVLLARDLKKVCSTYLDAFVRYQIDGVLHFNVNSVGAKTGRMSISRPSMQNLERSKRVRDAVLPREEDEKLVLADWQAQETRLIAHAANEIAMIEAFRSGADIHTFVASQVYGISEDQVNPTQRFRAKTLGHARNYGAGVSKVALTGDVAYQISKNFCAAYDAEFPQIPELHKRLNTAIHSRDDGNGRGWIQTYSGRRLWVDFKKAYTAANTYAQGSGADMMKRAIVNADKMGIGRYIVIPVHDELGLSVPEPLIPDVLPVLHQAMELEGFRVPMPIETKIVERWGDAYA